MNKFKPFFFSLSFQFPRYQKNIFPRSHLPYGGEHSQDAQVSVILFTLPLLLIFILLKPSKNGCNAKSIFNNSQFKNFYPTKSICLSVITKSNFYKSFWLYFTLIKTIFLFQVYLIKECFTFSINASVEYKLHLQNYNKSYSHSNFCRRI